MKAKTAEILKKLDSLKFSSDLGKGYTDVVLLHDVEKVLREYANQSKSLPTDVEIENIASRQYNSSILLEHFPEGNNMRRIIVSVITKALKHMRDTYKPTEWVSVEDMLPEENQDVIVYEPSTGTSCAELDQGMWYDISAACYFPPHQKVTHWMYLPEFKEDDFQEKLKKYLPEINSKEFPDDSDVAL